MLKRLHSLVAYLYSTPHEQFGDQICGEELHLCIFSRLDGRDDDRADAAVPEGSTTTSSPSAHAAVMLALVI